MSSRKRWGRGNSNTLSPEGGSQTSGQTKGNRGKLFPDLNLDQQNLEHMSQIQHSLLQGTSVFQEYMGITFPSFIFSLFQCSSSRSGYLLFVGIMGALKHSFRGFSVENATSSAPFKNRECETHQMDVTCPREVQRSRTEPLFLISHLMAQLEG